MNLTDSFSELSDSGLRIFELFCERAVEMEDPLASLGVEDVHARYMVSEAAGGDFDQSILLLTDRGYLQRSGLRHYSVTPAGFEVYANGYIDDYEEKQDAVKDAVAASDSTDTLAIMTQTGEKRYLVNHVLRILQRDRDIGAFVSESNCFYITRVSAAFKRRQQSGPAAISAGSPKSG